MSHPESALSRTLLNHAADALREVLHFEHPADGTLSHFFRENRKLGHRDRAFIAETVYAVVRRLRWLRVLAGAKASPRQLLLAWLARGEGWSMRQMEDALSGGDRNWVTELKGMQLPELSLADQADLPDWLATRLVAQLGEEQTLALARAMNRPAPLDLRVNPLRATREEVLAALAESNIAAEPGRYAPLSIRLAGKPPLHQHARFLDGSFEVQDEGSQLLAYLVQPRRGELVVDFCAGAGGKTLALGALMRSTGRLYAFDVSERRLARLKPRMSRAGLSNVHPVVIDSERDTKVRRLAGKADRVLVDAPCSGLGTLRRNPDLKWRQSEAAIDELTGKQAAILNAAAQLVRPGGRLVYATCSLLREENEDIISAFLAAHPDFRLLPAYEVLAAQGIAIDCGETLRIDPLHHDTDGFFAAVLERGAQA